MPPTANRVLAYSIDGFVEASGICRTNVYGAIKTGELRARKYLGRTIILAADARAFLRALPACGDERGGARKRTPQRIGIAR